MGVERAVNAFVPARASGSSTGRIGHRHIQPGTGNWRSWWSCGMPPWPWSACGLLQRVPCAG